MRGSKWLRYLILAPVAALVVAGLIVLFFPFVFFDEGDAGVTGPSS